MESELHSPDYISGRVEGEVILGNQAYTVRGIDYGSSFHLKVEGDSSSYSQTHNYSEISQLENSNNTIEELFDIARENTENWDSEDQILYLGERDLDEIRL